jgi:hypothetical protein
VPAPSCQVTGNLWVRAHAFPLVRDPKGSTARAHVLHGPSAGSVMPGDAGQFRKPVIHVTVAEAALLACTPDYELLMPVLGELERQHPEPQSGPSYAV